MGLTSEQYNEFKQQLEMTQGAEFASMMLQHAARAGFGQDKVKACASVQEALDELNFYSGVGAQLTCLDSARDAVRKEVENASIEHKRELKRKMLEQHIAENYDQYQGPGRNEFFVKQVEAAFRDLSQPDGGTDEGMDEIYADLGLVADDSGRPVIDESKLAELESMMMDPRYSDPAQRDEEFIASVQRGFSELTGGEATPQEGDTFLMGDDS